MEDHVQFSFRGKRCNALFTICKKEEPVYIYITLKNADLAQEFGEEIVLHSSGLRLLLENVYTLPRKELYKAIYNAISLQDDIEQISSNSNYHNG